MREKKGQITVYIIIGIIVLVSVGVFLYIRTTKVEAPASYAPTIEQIPVEAEPIRQFVSSCLGQVAEDGLKKVGDYGGYTSREEMNAHVNPIEPTEGDAVQFSPDSDLIIPYWWYIDSPNDCEQKGKCNFNSKRPYLFRTEGTPSIETQLDKYVEDSLNNCLADFNALADFGFAISEAGDMEVKTVVTKESVAFHLNYPLLAEKGGVRYTLNEYFVDIPLNLAEIYEVATAISNMQAEYYYLENFIVSLISMYSGLNEDALPPFGGTSLDPSGGLTWMKSEVKTKVMQIISTYMPLLRVPNTRNFKPVTFPEGTHYRNAKLTLLNTGMVVPALEEPTNSLEVRHTYLDWWNPFFYLNCNGELCKSQEVSGIGEIMFFLQRYAFNYDISLPVLVSITNPKAFNRKGYSFKFFLEANIRNNDAIAEGIEEPLEAADVGPVGSLMCNPNQMTSPEVRVVVSESMSGQPIEDVFIQYRCGDEQCRMGQTGEDGTVTTKFPVCVGGLLQADKEGYQTAVASISTDHTEPKEAHLVMHDYMEKDIKVMKYKFTKTCITSNQSGFPIPSCSWNLGTVPVELTPKEEAVVTMKLNTQPGEIPFTTFADYSGDPSVEDASKNMRIIPGAYDIDIAIMTKEKIVIPEDEVCTDVIGIEISCEDIDAVEFGEDKPLFSGGANLKRVPLNPLQLHSNDIIVLYAVTIAFEDMLPSLRKHKDLGKIGEIESYSETYKSMLMPTYLKKEVYNGTRGNVSGTI